MDITDILHLPCPDGTDQAAQALYLQRLAERLEAEFIARQARVDAVVNQPAACFKNTTAISAFGTTGQAQVSMLTPGNVVYANYPGASLPAFPPGPFPTPGIYHMGISVFFQEVGAVTTGSYRQLTYQLLHYGPAGIVGAAEGTREVTAPSFGGVYLTAEMIAEIGSDFAQYGLNIILRHGNAASNIQVPIGGIHAYLVRRGSSDIIEVV